MTPTDYIDHGAVMPFRPIGVPKFQPIVGLGLAVWMSVSVVILVVRDFLLVVPPASIIFLRIFLVKIRLNELDQFAFSGQSLYYVFELEAFSSRVSIEPVEETFFGFVLHLEDVFR